MPDVKAAKLAVYHHGCWSAYTVKKFPDVKLRLVSPVTFLRHKGKFIDYEGIWEASAPSEQTLDNYLRGLKRAKDVYGIETLARRKLSAVFVLRVRSPGSIYEKVLESSSLYAEPVTIDKGLEMHSIVSADPKRIKRLLGEMEEVGEVKIVRIGAPDFGTNLYKLTDKQIQAVQTALNKGYYSWPRKATLEELATSIGTTRRAFQENLRKAEAKLFPEIAAELISERRKAKP